MSSDSASDAQTTASGPTADDGPGIDRTITLTDAVVAIAMTLLVLPLVEISGDLDPANLAGFWVDNRDLLMSFAISFVVIYAFWTGHGAIFRLLSRSGAEDVPGMSTLNMFWLLLIAFLPFPTAMIGRNLTTTSTVLYLGTMLVVSALMVAMSSLAHRAAGRQTRHFGVWLTTGVLAVATAVAFFQPSVALYLLLLLIPVRAVQGRLEGSGGTRPTPPITQPK